MSLDTTVTPAKLARVGVKEPDQASTHATALALLTDALRDAIRPMPTTLVDECMYRVARALKDSAATSGGTQQVQVGDGGVVPRAPRDPLASSATLISRYVIPL